MSRDGQAHQRGQVTHGAFLLSGSWALRLVTLKEGTTLDYECLRRRNAPEVHVSGSTIAALNRQQAILVVESINTAMAVSHAQSMRSVAPVARRERPARILRSASSHDLGASSEQFRFCIQRGLEGQDVDAGLRGAFRCDILSA